MLCILPPVIWGATFSANKVGLAYFTPVEQISLQLMAAVLVSSALVLAGRLWQRLSVRELAIVGLCGILEPGLTYLFGQHGLKFTNAGIVSVIFASEAVVTVVLLALLRLEAISARMFALACMAFAGVTMVVGGDIDGGGTGTALGYGLVVLAVLMASSYAIVSTAFAVRAHPIFLVLIQQIFALGLLLAYARASSQAVIPHGWRLIPTEQWVNLLVCGAAQFSIAFALFQLALRASPYRSVVFLNLIPPVGLIAGYFILGETLQLYQLAGVAVTILALTWISQCRARM